MSLSGRVNIRPEFLYVVYAPINKNLDILSKKMYNMNRVGENVVSVEQRRHPDSEADSK